MIIKIEKEVFAKAIHSVAKFAERRSATLPALSGIAIVAGNDGIKFRATNLETGIDLRVKGTIEDEGVMVLPATILKEVAGSLAGAGTITIEHAGETAVVSSGVGRSTLKTLPADDFPVIPMPTGGEHTFTLPGETLIGLITAVGSCASTSTVRPDLSSIFLSSAGGTLKAVASDSFRLAEKKVPTPGTTKPFSILIPAKNALEIAQVLPPGEVTVIVDEHQCAFTFDGGVLSTRLVTSPYPDYEQIIPKTFSAEATVLKKDFESGLRRTAVFSDTFQKVRLGFDQKGKKLAFSARNSDIGESAESIPAALTGDPVELSFNHRYLGAPLALIGADSLTVSASGIGRPLVLRGSGDTSFLYLVMPMNQ